MKILPSDSAEGMSAAVEAPEGQLHCKLCGLRSTSTSSIVDSITGKSALPWVTEVIWERAERARCEARARRLHSRTGKSALAAKHERAAGVAEVIRKCEERARWEARARLLYSIEPERARSLPSTSALQGSPR